MCYAIQIVIPTETVEELEVRDVYARQWWTRMATVDVDNAGPESAGLSESPMREGMVCSCLANSPIHVLAHGCMHACC